MPPDKLIWQGDVFADVPWSVLRTQDFVQPTGEGQRFVTVAPPLSGHKARLVTNSGRDLGMLLSHECTVDKGGQAPLTFGRVLPITTYHEQGRDFIRRHENYQTFHLPPDREDLLLESYVDFRFLIAIDPAVFRTFVRIASLSSESREALRHQLILYWTRSEPQPEHNEG